MRITTNDQVNARTADGRVYSAGAGAVTDVDDDDKGMVAMFRDLAATGLVDIAGDDEDVDEEESEPAETAETTDTAESVEAGDGYEDKTVPELRDLARDRGLPVYGPKDELIARLRD
jgi:hypothetical protein